CRMLRGGLRRVVRRAGGDRCGSLPLGRTAPGAGWAAWLLPGPGNRWPPAPGGRGAGTAGPAPLVRPVQRRPQHGAAAAPGPWGMVAGRSGLPAPAGLAGLHRAEPGPGPGATAVPLPAVDPPAAR